MFGSISGFVSVFSHHIWVWRSICTVQHNTIPPVCRYDWPQSQWRHPPFPMSSTHNESEIGTHRPSASSLALSCASSKTPKRPPNFKGSLSIAYSRDLMGRITSADTGHLRTSLTVIPALARYTWLHSASSTDIACTPIIISL